MKKTLLLISAVAMTLVSCNKEQQGTNGENGKPVEFQAEIKMEVPAELQYGQPVELSAVIETTEKISGAVMVGVKKSGETYQVVGENQTAKIEGNNAKVLFFADSKDITAVEVTFAAGNKEAKAYFPTTVAGELQGTVWFSDPAVFKASPKVATHENNPEAYPEKNTAAGCDEPSFFSMHGLKIGNEVKHIVSLSEARPLDGKNLSCFFANCYQNTANNAVFNGERGFGFFGMQRTTAGTVGRQCDIYEVDGHSILKECEVEKTGFALRLVRGSWKGADHWNPEEYKFIDGLYTKMEKAETNLEKMQAYYELGEIQRVLDNATLVTEPEVAPAEAGAEEPELTSFGGTSLLRQYVNMGPTGAKPSEVFRPGDYIIFRSKRQTAEEETPRYYYGIMQIQQIPDVSKTFVDIEGKPEKRMNNLEELEKLYGKPCYVGIKTQCEIQ